MIPYIPHVALLISLCLVFYKIFLEKETFFKINRWLLLGCVILAFSIPLFEIPENWSIWQEDLVLPIAMDERDSDFRENVSPAPEANIAPEELTPVEEASESLETQSTPLEKKEVAEESSLAPEAEETLSEEAEAMEAPILRKNTFSQFLNTINFPKVVWYVYLIGLAIFGINLLIQLFALLIQIIRSPSLKDGRYRIIEMSQDKAPYSFMNCIFINPTKYDWDTYNQILEHEKIHIQQWHSLDMILAEILVVLQWFNPLAWQYRKAIENNLEYLTDSAMLHKGADREPYQMNLLKVSVPQYPVGLAMNYNQSFLKKRIKMMNAKKSSVRTSWKYLAIVPLLGLSILCLNAVQVAAKQDRNSEIEANFAEMEEQINAAVENVVVEEMNEPQEVLAEETREMALEIEAMAEQALKEMKSPMQEAGNLLVGGNSPMDMRGMWQAEINGDRVCVRFDNSNFERNSFWISTECFQRSDFSDLPTSEGEFNIERDAGKVVFKGKFEDDYGMGRYTFEPNATFAKYLKDEGIRGEAKEETMFHFFLSDIDRSYVSELKSEGYKGLDMKQLKKLAIHDVDRQYIRDMAKAGYSDLSLEDLVKGRIHDVDPDYIQELAGMGFDDLDFDDLVKFSIHDVDAEMAKELSQAGFKDLSAEDMIKASIHNVDADYIRELKEVGYELEDLDEIVRFSIHNVDADFVKALKDAGYSDLSADKITKAAIHNVDPEYIQELASVGYELDNIDDVVRFAIHNVDADLVKALKDVGYTNLSAKEITNAAIHNVRPQYIKDLKSAGIDMPEIDDVIKFKIHNVDIDFIEALEKAGYNNLDPSDIRRAAIHNVSARYINELKASGVELPYISDVIRFATHNVSVSFIKDLKDLGYDNLDADDIVKAKIHNVRPSMIQGLNDLGFKNIPMDKVINLKIHGVTPSFIKGAREKGYKDLSLDEYKKIKIHGIYRQ